MVQLCTSGKGKVCGIFDDDDQNGPLADVHGAPDQDPMRSEGCGAVQPTYRYNKLVITRTLRREDGIVNQDLTPADVCLPDSLIFHYKRFILSC